MLSFASMFTVIPRVEMWASPYWEAHGKLWRLKSGFWVSLTALIAPVLGLAVVRSDARTTPDRFSMSRCWARTQRGRP